MAILGKNGFFNDLLQFLRIIDEPLQMLYTEGAVIVGLTYLFLPLMILPLVGVIENIEEDLLDSAKSLGAKDIIVFFQIILPLSASGLLVGSILVFTGSLTAYTTPRLLGGDQAMTLSTLIYQNAMTLFEWDAASVIAIIMITLTILVMKIIGSLATRMNPDV
jgi:putative spermidine/putrescine transport system permease protein